MDIELEASLQHIFGQPARTARFRQGNIEYGLGKWSVTAKGSTYVLYIPYCLSSSKHRELTILLCTTAIDGVVSELCKIQRERDLEHAIKPGDTLNMQTPLWDAAPFEAVYFTSPVGVLAALLLTKNIAEQNLTFTQVIPIYPSELVVKKVAGQQRFRQLLLDAEYLNPNRNLITCER